MKYSRLQYISSGKTPEEHYINIRLALVRGVSWIQIRIKHTADHEIDRLIKRVILLKEQFSFTLIINDYVSLANDAAVDGVHLGLGDMPVLEAKAILSPSKIIGGTANSTADVQQRIKEGCDYIGLGPLRYTETKEKLSPLLGFEGYRSVIKDLGSVPCPPIFAIGGIAKPDISRLRKIGLYGVALSKCIQANFTDEQHIEHLNTLLYGQEIENCR
ncbi:thiamine phosphate synthase [Sphingobacterium griseoflavum]|uniref:Thiamine-phosphate synthase n=1 Tax=Sphingobacterium griseoflavum TaxID=1474952 RepID=A0ABQ3HX92_9SPHI|nr:thiamine phosphate synthase [Sphingobacterium griseoflavum]GHE33601.1 thiamine-phosphate synthase [Sphingobacterium griseoflavum]